MRRRASLAAALCLALASAGRAQADPVFSTTSPYLSVADSPFEGLDVVSYRLEDFEDGALNVTGVTASPGWTVLGPGSLTDSVDGDDGVVDGSGTGGHSYYSNGQSSLTFTFDPAAVGGLPTFAGIAWTDVGFTTTGLGVGNVTFEAFDALGVSLGLIGPTTLGDGLAGGFTAEDVFFGVTYSGGLSAIRISMADSVDWEVDHLYFGTHAAVPEPASLLMAGLGGGALLIRRRAGRRASAAGRA